MMLELDGNVEEEEVEEERKDTPLFGEGLKRSLVPFIVLLALFFSSSSDSDSLELDTATFCFFLFFYLYNLIYTGIYITLSAYIFRSFQ